MLLNLVAYKIKSTHDVKLFRIIITSEINKERLKGVCRIVNSKFHVLELMTPCTSPPQI